MNLKQWPIIIIVLVGISQMIYADVYKQNPYTGKPDNTGEFSQSSAAYRRTFVPYSGATKEVDLSPQGLRTQYSVFSPYTLTTPPTEHGAVFWNRAKGTLDINMGYDSVVQQVGMEQYYPPVRAKTAAISNGTVVMVDPLDILSGERFNAIPAVATGSYPSKLMLGMATMDIPHNQTGYVTRFGEVHDLPLSALKPVGETWTEGEILWCNPAVPGGLTDTEPTAPNLKMSVAVVQKVVGNDLDLFVRFEVTPGINELHNVNTSGLSLYDFLIYNSVAGRWENKPATGIPTVTNSPKFTNNSGYTASHIRSVSPYGNHPAAGSNRQIQYNNVGTPAGAAMLNYSGSQFGVGTSNPHTLGTFRNSVVTSQLNFNNSQNDVGGYLTSVAENNFFTSSGVKHIAAAWKQQSSDRRGTVIGGGATGLTFYNASSASVGATTTLKMQMRLSAAATCAGSPQVCVNGSGGVGINTASPDARLTVKGVGTTTGAALNIKDSADSLKMTITDSGLVFFTNSGGLPYGQMYSNTSTTIPVASAGVWYEVDTGATDFTAGRLKNVTHTDHYLTAPTAGDYKIDAAASFGTSAAGDEIALSVMINGTASATCHGHATVVTATTTVPSSCVTILTLAANDQVSLAVQNHSAARNITLSHSQLSILHVGAP